MHLAIINENKSKVNQIVSWKQFALKAEYHKNKMKKILANYSKKKLSDLVHLQEVKHF